MEGKPRPANKDGFTPEQQFFISWGQSRGDEIRPDAQRQFVLTNPHPISKYRVLGPLSNSPEFQKAFSCKAGDAWCDQRKIAARFGSACAPVRFRKTISSEEQK